MALLKRKKPKKASPKKKQARKSFLNNEKFRFILGVLVLIANNLPVCVFYILSFLWGC